MYEVLGVDRSCSKSELKSAFRNLARQYHPDVNDAPDAKDKFNEISNAYTVSIPAGIEDGGSGGGAGGEGVEGEGVRVCCFVTG